MTFYQPKNSFKNSSIICIKGNNYTDNQRGLFANPTYGYL